MQQSHENVAITYILWQTVTWKDPPCYVHGKIHYFDWAIFIHFPVRKLFPCISESKVAVDLCTYLFIYMLYSRFLSSNRPETLQSLLPSMFP